MNTIITDELSDSSPHWWQVDKGAGEMKLIWDVNPAAVQSPSVGKLPINRQREAQATQHQWTSLA